MARQTLLPDRVFDSVEGRMLTGHAIVIDSDRIEAVVPAGETPDATPLPGHSILPGLIDCHTHLVGPVDNGQGYAQLVTRNAAQDALIGVKHAATTIKAGFTTVRDIGTFRAFADVALRDAIEDGWVEGPRMMVAGAYVTCPGGGGDITGLAADVDASVPRDMRFGVSSGVDQMRANVRQILRYGADFIKVIATGAVLTSGTNPGAPEFTEDEIRAAVEAAQRPEPMSPLTPTGPRASNGRSGPEHALSSTGRSSTTRPSSSWSNTGPTSSPTSTTATTSTNWVLRWGTARRCCASRR
jgi:imidazolonepropionase-like amidohydrolase